MVLLYLITIYYLKRSASLNRLQWDADTITAGDYTLEYNFPKEAFEHWYNNIFRPE